MPKTTKIVIQTTNKATTLATLLPEDIKYLTGFVGDLDYILDPDATSMTNLAELLRVMAVATRVLAEVSEPRVLAAQITILSVFCSVALTCFATGVQFDITAH